AAAPCGTRRTLRIIVAARGFGDLAVLSIGHLLVRTRASGCAPAALWLVLVAVPLCGRRSLRLPRRMHLVGGDFVVRYLSHGRQTAMSDMPERWTFHGGRLSEARSVYGDGAEPWLVLSTGINPHCWPGVRDLPIHWGALPDERNLVELEAAAAACFSVHPDHL